VPFTIGAATSNAIPGFYYTGKIDDIKIYNRILTANEITLLKNEGNPTVGLNDTQLPKNALLVYPNPTSNLLYVEVLESTPLTILNVLGETVKQQTIKGLGSIDVSSLNTGIYYIQSHMGKNTKFIKE
jgi:hypothetical protein